MGPVHTSTLTELKRLVENSEKDMTWCPWSLESYALLVSTLHSPFAMGHFTRVADIVLLMVDASYGFEMETFEFLNIAQSHGFPKVLGCLSYLDKFKTAKKLKRTKKALKHRYVWAGGRNGETRRRHV